MLGMDNMINHRILLLVGIRMTRWIWMRQWRGLVRGLEQVPNGAYMVDDDSSGEEIMDSDSDYSDKFLSCFDYPKVSYISPSRLSCQSSNRSMREAEREEDGEESMGKDGLVAHDGGEAIGEAYIGAVVRVMVLEKKMAMRAMVVASIDVAEMVNMNRMMMTPKL
ncbi:hypothetical protein E1A91_D13G093300v1 [Gossypium mustelinum]|uniref:Uncharacterized protein n=1 Tax=Gossypium mustelinum TaxID=34275 RepID=A0A5D2S1L7_GOSMU|nr:hypothetical protein E1A91_D13G093300v1 [Gossypium mustelinum]